MFLKFLALFVFIFSSYSLAGNTETTYEKWEKAPKCRFIHPFTKVEKYLSPDSMQITGKIVNGLAEITFNQHFENPVDTILNLEYNFPMPQNASIHGFKYWSDEDEFNSQILKTEDAQQLFDSLSEAGHQAAILSQIKPNIFAQGIANIPIGGKIKVEIKLSYPLEYLDGFYSFTFPTLIGERFQSNDDEIPSSNLGWNPDDSLVDGIVKVKIDIINEIEFQNVTHSLSAHHTSDTTKQIILSEGIIIPNKDIIFRIKAKESIMGMNLSSYKEAADSVGYFNFKFTPPDSLFETQENKEVLFLLDRSGSQGGWPLDYQKEIAKNLIESLPSESYIQIMAFDDTQDYAFNSSVKASAYNKNKAYDFIDAVREAGGTQLYSALKSYLDKPRISTLPRVLIFLTDGFITNEESIFQYLTTHEDRPSIISFGLGNNVNHYFLEEASQIGNGYSVTVPYGSDLNEISNQTATKIITQEVVLNSISWGNSGASDIRGIEPNSFFPGSRYSVFGKYTTPGIHKVCLNTISKDIENTYCNFQNFTSADTSLSSLPKNWAKQKIKDLETIASTDTQIKEDIIDLSIEYQVLSNYTSFIAYQFSQEDIYEDLNQGGSAPSFATPNINLTLPTTIQFNISNQELSLKSSAHKIEAIQIYDLNGNLIFESTSSLNNFIWDGENSKNQLISQGQFFIRFIVDGKVFMKSFTWN